MGFLDLFALSVALGVDILSVSLGLGVAGPSKRRIVQLGTAFALMAGVLVGAGYFTATGLHVLLGSIGKIIGLGRLGGFSPEVLHEQAHFVFSLLGGAILCGIGLHLLLAKDEERSAPRRKPFAVRGMWGVLWLATLVSIDAVSAGLSLGMIEGTKAIHAIVAVAIVNGVMSFFGLSLGRRLHSMVGRRLRPAGGVLLIAIALKLLWALLAE